MLKLYVLIVLFSTLRLYSAAARVPNINTTTTTTTTPKSLRFPLKRRSYTEIGKTDFTSSVRLDPQDEYYTDLKIGIPPRSYSLVIDTGSHITWVRCFDCQYACKSNKYFDPKESQTYDIMSCSSPSCPPKSEGGKSCGNNNECRYSITFADNTTSYGVMAKETITVVEDGDSVKLYDIPIGCAERTLRNEKFAVRYIDGLMGLSMGSASFFSLVEVKYGFSKFSYCLVNRVTDPLSGSELVFGEQALGNTKDLIYTPFANRRYRDHYSIDLLAISIGSVTLAITRTIFPTEIILDTGSTNTFLPTSAYVSISDRYREIAANLGWRPIYDNTNRRYRDCYYVTQAELLNCPTMMLHFRGEANLLLKPHNIWRYFPGDNSACLAFRSGSISILGNINQQGMRVVHDIGERRIGFSPSSC